MCSRTKNKTSIRCSIKMANYKSNVIIFKTQVKKKIPENFITKLKQLYSCFLMKFRKMLYVLYNNVI